MTTFSQHHQQRLLAADQARRNRELREEVARQEALRRSETGRFVICICVALVLAITAWLIVWSWVAG
jgi:hypothetical protein